MTGPPETESVGPLPPPSGRSVDARLGLGPFAGRFAIRERLRRGGQATVYRAFDDLRGVEVALKIAHPEHDPARALSRLRREVRIAHDAASPFLVRIYDLGLAGDGLYLTMEYLPGGSLRDRLARGPVAVEEAVRIAESVLHGLAALHAKRGIHRDVKPANILFTAAGEARLADFGLVSLEGPERTKLTEEGGVLGTVGYLAPELLFGGVATPASDLYAVGVVFCEMLCGAGREDDPSAAARARRSSHLSRDPGAVQRSAPRWLARIVARLLAARAAARYASADEVLRDLRRRRSPTRRGLRRWVFPGLAALLALPSVVVPSPGFVRFEIIAAVKLGGPFLDPPCLTLDERSGQVTLHFRSGKPLDLGGAGVPRDIVARGHAATVEERAKQLISLLSPER